MPLVAICIGHSRTGDRGAVSVDGTTEWTFNRQVGKMVVARLMAAGFAAMLIDKYEGRGYTGAMRWLAGYLKKLGVTQAIELHFNSDDNPKAQGFEYVHHIDSRRGQALATALTDRHRGTFKSAYSRGLQARSKGGRGWAFLNLTPCPAVICEPFFGSNSVEWAAYKSDPAKLAECYAEALISFLSHE